MPAAVGTPVKDTRVASAAACYCSVAVVAVEVAANLPVDPRNDDSQTSRQRRSQHWVAVPAVRSRKDVSRPRTVVVAVVEAQELVGSCSK